MASDPPPSLTPAQLQAVRHVEGPLLILAGPGSGKTRVITHRIAHLLEKGIPARRILALTFTNKAADEMRNRVAGLAPGQPVWMGTFHRFCARLLRRHAPLVGLNENFTIYDADDSLRVVKRVIREDQEEELVYHTPEKIAHAISWAKNSLITHTQYQPKPGNPLGAVVADVYPAYQRRLLASNAVDFDDLLLHTAVLLRGNPELRATLDDRYCYILVDEYQDTNLAQYAIVRAMSIDHPNLAVTGDPDQSIYGWRGANLKNILEFEKDFPHVQVVRLERNYRSTKNILLVADELIVHNRRRKHKELYTENESGRPVRLVCYPTHTDEAEAIARRIARDVETGRRSPKDFAVFYRVNALSRSIEDALRNGGIPYQIVSGVEFYQRKEIKDVLAYLQLLNNPQDDGALLRIINSPPRGIGRTTIERLTRFAGERGLTMLESARQAGVIESLPKRAAVAVARFVAMIDRLGLLAAAPVEEILGNVLTESKYQQRLEKSNTEEDQNRLENIQDLLSAAREFDVQHPGEGHLEEFLEQASLVNDTDDWEEETEKVTLMTLHAAKGLEFPVVFIVAAEEGILPHERSRKNDVQLEEERRLLFVGITRAQGELDISLAAYRSFRGRSGTTIPSSFLMELPRDSMESIGFGPSPAVSPRADSDSSQGDDVPDWVTEDDDDYVQAAPSPPTPPPSTEPAPAMPVQLTTAADMLSDPRQQTTETVSPDVFHHGMVVMHPEYHLGKIVALSGEGDQRRATVNFASGVQRKFLLADSPLRPAKSPR